MGLRLASMPRRGSGCRRGITLNTTTKSRASASTGARSRTVGAHRSRKEQFYEIEADFHVMDPNFLQSRGSWEQSDIDEIERDRPLLREQYLFGGVRVARLHVLHAVRCVRETRPGVQRTDRFEAFESFHEEFQTSLEDLVPDSESERPDVAIVWAGQRRAHELLHVPYRGRTVSNSRLRVRDCRRL